MNEFIDCKGSYGELSRGQSFSFLKSRSLARDILRERRRKKPNATRPRTYLKPYKKFPTILSADSSGAFLGVVGPRRRRP